MRREFEKIEKTDEELLEINRIEMNHCINTLQQETDHRIIEQNEYIESIARVIKSLKGTIEVLSKSD